MRRTASVLGLLLMCAAPAAAKDFTGFYAGVNAGWGMERDHDSSVAPGPGLPGSAQAGEGLPPSVARAQERRLPGSANAGRER